MPQIPTIDDLKTKRGRLMEEINKLDIVIEFLSDFSIDVTPTYGNGHSKVEQSVIVRGNGTTPEWDKNAPLTRKVLLILQQSGRFMYVRQIADVARSIGEPEIKKGSKSNLQARISIILSVLRRDEKIVRIQLGASAETSVWGLPEWANGNNIKDQHTPMAK